MEMFPINSRIRIQGNAGTVKYVGQVDGFPGEWIGVDWDSVARGKHDGTVNGKKYFDTNAPTSGSLVKAQKIEPFISVEDMIRHKYLENNDTILDPLLMQETQRKLGANLFEVVGMEKIAKKQSHLSELSDISLARSNINASGDLNQLIQLQSLDLSSTLIWNWRIISDIVKQLPSLNYLVLSLNIFEIPDDDLISELRTNFEHVKNISLSQCRLVNWSAIEQTAKLWPYVESLSLVGNGISTINVPASDVVFKKLRTLDLSGNSLSIEEICNLGSIKSLERLILDDNGITEINLPDCDSDTHLPIFINLQELYLKKNTLSNEYKSFNELSKLKSLKHLCFTTNELTFEDTFYSAIGLIPTLKTFNRMQIESDTRRGAQYELWKHHAMTWRTTENDSIKRNAFRKSCRAYELFVKKYGLAMEEGDAIALKKSNVITINLRNSETNQVITKKLPRKITVQTLQGIISKLFRIDANKKIKLTYEDKEHPDIHIELDNNSKSLDYYSIEDGNSIVVI